MWLPRALGIELHVYDHDTHHARGMCNYSKRLILWDVVFGTRYQRRSQNRQ
jgi:sterol desaturase/sphingolipid hydroxylase (fatty acid hydroxylase superfamily)